MTLFSTRAALSAVALFVWSFTTNAQTTPAPVPTQATPASTTPTPTPVATPVPAVAPVAPATPDVAVQTPVLPTTGALLSPVLVTGSYKEYLMKRYANDRKALAVIHMFGKHHTGGLVWLGAGAGLLAFFATQAGTHDTGSGGSYTVTISPLGYVIFVGLPAVLGISKLSRFGSQAMHQAFLEYDKTGTFPGNVVKHVRNGDYRYSE